MYAYVLIVRFFPFNYTSCSSVSSSYGSLLYSLSVQNLKIVKYLILHDILKFVRVI